MDHVLPKDRIGRNTKCNSFISKTSKVGENCKIGRNIIGDYVDISEDVEMHSENIVGYGSKIHARVKIGFHSKFANEASQTDKNLILYPDVTIGDNVTLGVGVEVHQQSTIDDYSEVGSMSFIGDAVEIGKRVNVSSSVRIFEHSVINDGVVIQHGSIISEHSVIENGAIVAENVFIGKKTRISEAKIILNNAIIYGMVRANDVLENDIVIPYPTHWEMYMWCTAIGTPE